MKVIAKTGALRNLNKELSQIKEEKDEQSEFTDDNIETQKDRIKNTLLVGFEPKESCFKLKEDKDLDQLNLMP